MDETCKQGEERAVKDFEDGNMQITSYGLIVSDDYYFDEFYEDYLKENYQVEYANGGCIVWDALMCYEDKMLNLIEGKYGKNFLEHTRKEAKKEYLPQRAEIIEKHHDENAAGYVWADTMPEYPGGFPELLNYVNSEMEKQGIDEYKDSGKHFIQMVVEPDGSVSGLKTIRSTNEKVEQALVKIIEGAEKWNPGILNGEPVKVQVVLPFYNQ